MEFGTIERPSSAVLDLFRTCRSSARRSLPARQKISARLSVASTRA